MKKRISLILIIIGIVGILYIKINIIIDNNRNLEIINNELVGNNKYEGYIKIENLNVKRLITEGDFSNLDKNFVVIRKGVNTILYGHAVEQVFLKLYDIKILDKINLFLSNNEISYEVEDIYIVNKKKYDFSKYVDKLILVTCLLNDDRLIIVAKKNDISHF